jgi:hypothetical protein
MNPPHLYQCFLMPSMIVVWCTVICDDVPMGTPSLKILLPEIGRILGESETALYERVRALVRERMLKSLAGRGRGSGVRASPESLAVLLCAMLATTNWSETAVATKALVKAHALMDGKCPLTGAATFRDALTHILASESIAERIEEIEFASAKGEVYVRYDRPPLQPPPLLLPSPHSIFMGGLSRIGGLYRDSFLTGDAVRAVTKLVQP